MAYETNGGLDMSTCLVSGVGGFIGSHVAENLLKDGHKVIGVDDFSGGYSENIPKGITLTTGSITTPGLMSLIFERDKPEYVFHLAAYAAESLSNHIKRYNYENNLLGSINLINESVKHKVKCFVFVSSIAVYGRGLTPFREDDPASPPCPIDSYGLSKLTVERELQITKTMFGLPYIIFRPHNVYGPRQNIWDKYRNLLGIFLRQLMDNEPLTIFGDGFQIRSFTYIDEVAPVIAKSIKATGMYNGTFNIGSDEAYTVLQIADNMAHRFGVKLRIKHLAQRHEVKIATCDHSLIHTWYPYKFPEKVSLAQGLENMINWVKSIKAPIPRSFTGTIEIAEKLPEGW